MNKIKEITIDKTNWIEVTIANELEEIIHCESFGDSDEYQALVMQRCIEFEVELTEEHLDILTEQKANRHIPTEDELAEIGRLVEEQRIAGIKAEAGSIIKSRYSIEWQLNHPRLDEAYSEQYAWIDRIREISNEAEANVIQLEDIVWG